VCFQLLVTGAVLCVFTVFSAVSGACMSVVSVVCRMTVGVNWWSLDTEATFNSNQIKCIGSSQIGFW